MASTLLLAALVLAPSVPHDPPFEALGNELLALERPELVPEPQERPSPEDRLRQHLAGVHERIPLGAIELWVPVETIVSPGRAVPGLEPRDVVAWARALVELQRRWLPRLDLDQDALESARAHIDSIESWVKGFRRRGELPEAEAETMQAQVRVEAAFLTTPPIDRDGSRMLPPLVILLAPTRTHYVATLGAIGLEMTGERPRLWSDQSARATCQLLTFRTALVGSTICPPPGDGPVLLDVKQDRSDLSQTIVHIASLLLTNNLSTTLPTWFAEGIAIGDTVALEGADETLFSGHRRSAADRSLSQVSNALNWIYAENSPYRDGPSRKLFARELRKAHDKSGFRIHDLVKGGVGMHARGPFLGPTSTLPDELKEGPVGLRNGFAEFFRAYAAAFVHWLETSEDEGSSATRLNRVLYEVKALCMGREPGPRHPLASAVERVYGRTLGVSEDSQSDLEAEFCAQLVGR